MSEHLEHMIRRVLQNQERDNALIRHIHNHAVQNDQRMERLMASLDEVIADVADESTKIDSLAAFIAGLKQQIVDALAGTTLPPAVQAKVDAVFAGVEANKAKVVAAMDANVPPAL